MVVSRRALISSSPGDASEGRRAKGGERGVEGGLNGGGREMEVGGERGVEWVVRERWLQRASSSLSYIFCSRP